MSTIVERIKFIYFRLALLAFYKHLEVPYFWGMAKKIMTEIENNQIEREDQ